MCVHPMCLYSVYSEFVREFNNGQNVAIFRQHKMYLISDHQLSEMATTVVGGALHLQLESPGCNP